MADEMKKEIVLDFLASAAAGKVLGGGGGGEDDAVFAQQQQQQGHQCNTGGGGGEHPIIVVDCGELSSPPAIVVGERRSLVEGGVVNVASLGGGRYVANRRTTTTINPAGDGAEEAVVSLRRDDATLGDGGTIPIAIPRYDDDDSPVGVPLRQPASHVLRVMAAGFLLLLAVAYSQQQQLTAYELDAWEAEIQRHSEHQ